MGPSVLLGRSLVLAPAFVRLSKGVFSHQARDYLAGSLRSFIARNEAERLGILLYSSAHAKKNKKSHVREHFYSHLHCGVR